MWCVWCVVFFFFFFLHFALPVYVVDSSVHEPKRIGWAHQRIRLHMVPVLFVCVYIHIYIYRLFIIKTFNIYVAHRCTHTHTKMQLHLARDLPFVAMLFVEDITR